MRLFIFGNGFDLKHELPTNYGDFRDVLTSDVFCNEIVNVIDNTCDDVENWSDLESAIGNINLDEYFEDVPMDYDEIAYTTALNDKIGEQCLRKCEYFKSKLVQWIRNINVINANKELCFEKFFSQNSESDKFMTFNYTNTLELLYNCQNVLHIHGDVQNDEEIVFGCFSPEDDAISEYLYVHPGAENAWLQIRNLFLKDANEIMDNYSAYFESLSNVTDIYSFGVSYSAADIYYLKIISEYIENDFTIHLYKHTSNEFQMQKQRIENLIGTRVKVVEWAID